MVFVKGQSGNPAGAKKGMAHKSTTELKEMILAALDANGGVEYLRAQAVSNPTAFLTLIGKVLPHTVNANLTGGITIVVPSEINKAG